MTPCLLTGSAGHIRIGGDYSNLAFCPEEGTTVRDMLSGAKRAVDKTFCGWKGGNYKMHESVDVLIGDNGCEGEPITKAWLKYNLLYAELAAGREAKK